MAPAFMTAPAPISMPGPQVATFQLSEPSGSVPTLAPARTFVFSPMMAYFISAPSSTTAPGMRMLYVTVAPLPTRTELERTLFSTRPSISQPSVTMEWDILLSGPA